MCDNHFVLTRHRCVVPNRPRPKWQWHLSSIKAAVLAGTLGLVSTEGAVTIQKPTDIAGPETNRWSYLKLEGENFETQADEDSEIGFASVDKSGAVTSFLGKPVLGPNSTASGSGALFTKTVFAEHADKVTYKVQFATPGTYYLFMRFTMFENGGSEGSYGNEDSFFVPPDFGKDPQTDWPLPRDGYTEGCCDAAGYLYIKDEPGGSRNNHFAADEERTYWEGNFHWNELISSQWNVPENTGAPNVRFKYEVTPDKVGTPRSEEHTSELQSQSNLVCRLLLEKKK